MRWVFRGAGVLASLAVLLVAALLLIPGERIARIALQQVEATTGQVVDVHGAVRVALHPLPVVTLHDVTLANAQWSDAGPLLRVATVELGLNPSALMRSRFELARITLQSPELLLERAADGRINWDLARRAVTGTAQDAPLADSDAAGDARAGAIALPQVILRDARARYRDAVTGADLDIGMIEAELTLPADGSEGRLVGEAVFRAQPLEFSLQVETPAALFGTAHSANGLQATLEAKAASAVLRFTGRVGAGQTLADGQMSLSLPDREVIARLGGRGIGTVPAAMMPVSLQGRAGLSANGRLDLRAATLRLGPNTLHGDLALEPGAARPRLSGALRAEALDLSMIAPRAGTPVAHAWSTEPMDFAALGGLDADLSIAADTLRIGDTRVSPVRLALRIDAARAVVDLQQLGLFDGTLEGEFVVNGRGNGSVGGDLRLDNMSLRPMLQTLAGIDRLEGRASMRVQYLGLGRSMHAIMNSLSGNGSLQARGGAITGFDLAEILRTLDLAQVDSRQRTAFERLTGSFTVDAGVLSNDDLLLDSPRMTLRGRGTVGLGDRTVAYQIIPEAERARGEGETLRVPLLIAGPWSAPRIRLDLEALARERLEQRRQQVQDAIGSDGEGLREELRGRVGDIVRDAIGAGEGRRPGAPDRLRGLLGRD